MRQSGYINALANQYSNKFNQIKPYRAIEYGTSTQSSDSCKTKKPNNEPVTSEINKPSIFQKMKQLTKDYWYILIPVHIVTSIGWGSMFYVAAKKLVFFFF